MTPTPGKALADAVSAMKPVRTRAPWRSLALLLVGLTVYASLPPLFLFRLRPDLPDLPSSWLLGVGFAWLLGLILPLMAALIPRRGQVLPDGGRGGFLGVAATLALIAVSLLFPAAPSSHSSRIPGLFGHCLALGM